MSILTKISDVLKEVFWFKTSKKKTARKKAVKKKTAKKKIVLSKPAKLGKAVVKKLVTAVKKPTKALKVKVPIIDPNLVLVGEITHYFDRIKVCVVKITGGTILIGDKLTVLGVKTKFVQKIWSMQIESKDVKVAKKGQIIGIKVEKPVVVGDKVYK